MKMKKEFWKNWTKMKFVKGTIFTVSYLHIFWTVLQVATWWCSCPDVYLTLLCLRLLWGWHQSTLHRGCSRGSAAVLSSDLRQQPALPAWRGLHRFGATGLWSCSALHNTCGSKGPGSSRPGPFLRVEAPAGAHTGPNAGLPDASLPPRRAPAQGTHTWYAPICCCWILCCSVSYFYYTSQVQ